jgi:hypothetical protein
VDTSGNSLAVLKISLTDYWSFVNSFDSVGFTPIGNEVLLGTKQDLIDYVNIIELSEPGYPPKITVSNDFDFNEITIGYPALSNDVGALNGNEEFNVGFNWSLGTLKRTGKLDKISKIKASCYEQEKIRVTLFEKQTTDNKNDNTLFVNWIDPTLQTDLTPNYYNLDRSLNSIASGLIEPDTIWNLRLSPKRNFYRNGSYFRSSLYLADNLTIKYQSSDKNNKLVCDGIIEKADVPVSTLDDKFFYPVVFEIEVAAPADLVTLLDTNPLQIYSFPFDGNLYYGILIKVSIAPSSRKSQTYQLLSASTNDLTKLIEYYG